VTDQPDLPTTEPYPFATVLQLKPGGRHELLTAVVYSEPDKCNGSGYRYHCLFPVDDGIRVSKVYSEEIESVTGLDLSGDILCSGCPDGTHKYCVARGVTPATCA